MHKKCERRLHTLSTHRMTSLPEEGKHVETMHALDICRAVAKNTIYWTYLCIYTI